jgi:[ribosomal protein S18]-alanine N-acetyltransferase
LTYKIRYMTKNDLPQVVEIDKEAFPTQWPPTNYRSELQNNLARYFVVCQDRAVSVPETKKPDRGFFPRIKRLFGYKEPVLDLLPQEYIVGFAGGWIMADELHITEIAVRGTHRRRGIGHLLLIALIETGLELKALYATLEVRESNVTAQNLYETFGFEKVGMRKAYYTDNREDALIMTTKSFKSPEYLNHLASLKKALAAKWQFMAIPGVPKLN